MGKFNREGGFGGKKFGGRDRSYDRNAPREMHKAICAECGEECEVPFKPSGDRPVLCSICFKQSGRGNDRNEGRREERRNFDRPRNEDKRMFDAVCAECGQHCQVPFQPKPGRDIFCSDCFGREDKREDKPFTLNQAPQNVNYNKQFDALNSKLDKLIYLLSPKSKSAAKPVEVAVKKEAVKPAFAKASADKVEKKIVNKIDKKISPKKKPTSAKATADKTSKKK
ncbi:MAG: hypothetical protein PHO56_01700 [Patescibacteria group bacterium]|nr:hypothetical protein [Patescibacteria group bacterium]